MPAMGILLLAYASAMAVATFVENDYGAPIAKFLIYNAWWFELIQFLLVVNMIGNVFVYKLYQKSKISILIFHLAFIIILIGAGITRYIGYEGIMHIREGQEQNKFVSEKSYLRIWDKENLVFEKSLFVSPFLKNEFSDNFKIETKKYTIELKKLLYNPTLYLSNSPNGKPIVDLVVMQNQMMSNVFLESEKLNPIGNHFFSVNKKLTDSSFVFYIENDRLFFQTDFECSVFDENGATDTIYPAQSKQEITSQKVMGIKGLNFAVKNFSPKAQIKYKQGKITDGITTYALAFEIWSDNKQTELILMETSEVGKINHFNLNNENLSASFGHKEIELPFSLKLLDFQLERYPGSHSPSSYASEVTLIDKSNNLTKDFRIFMNNILSHKGFRFYQSSYDEDEKGTILSVNHDRLGTYITYFGYLLLLLGILWSLVHPKSFLADLSRRTSAIRQKRNAMLGVLLFLLAFNNQSFAQNTSSRAFDKNHAELFGKLLVQDPGGRIKPMLTMSNEVLRKVARTETWDGFNSNQVFLGLLFDSHHWKTVKFIKVGNPELIKKLGLSGGYVAFTDLVNETQGTYLLANDVEMAFAKPAAEQSKYDKEIIAVNERLNILYEIFTWKYLRIFPSPEDSHKSWLTPFDAGNIKDSLTHEFAKTAFSKYYTEITKAWTSNNWRDADVLLISIQDFQKKYAADIIPSETKQNMEILYYKLNIFERLFKYYAFTGLLFLITLFIGIIKPKMNLKKISLFFTILLGFMFFTHTFGLGLRWYISGHAPFSNGYESMIYIAWAVVLAGFIFAKKSPITLAATGILASITLLVAHLSWMNPEITNLVPVLKSYWLTIHVSVITASYGFLALGAIIGLMILIFILLANSKNKEQINLTIAELTNVNHMTLIIGVYLLTIGTFLGAVWANESWGRYWGWDPKETWALISIIVYTFVLHSRFIPFLNDKFTFNLLSLLGFSSILMTYFGVNFYLSGLHSYAQGDPVPIPEWVYYTVISVFILAIAAYFKSKTILNPENESTK